MSGHSKWSTIKRQKNAKDALRGNVFTKLGNSIANAAKSGTDPETNFALRLAIDKAKAANMPMVNIQRAIDRQKDKNLAELQEIFYEGYGPNRSAIIVQTLTDNINRTLPNVKLAFTKHGGSLAEKGSVLFLFSHLGQIQVESNLEQVFEIAVNAGANDIEEDEEDNQLVNIYTNPKDLNKVRETLIQQKFNIKMAELIYKPHETIDIVDPSVAGKIIRLIDALDDLDEVINTFVNFRISDSIMEKLDS